MVYTKRGEEVFAPKDSAGDDRPVMNKDAQIWATEVERKIVAASLVDFVTGGWVTDTAYTDTQALTHNDVLYRCIANHTSGSTTEPGVGASWQTVWEVMLGAIALSDNSVTNAKLANMAAGTVKMRLAGAGAGAPVDATQAQVKTFIGNASDSTDGLMSAADKDDFDVSKDGEDTLAYRLKTMGHQSPLDLRGGVGGAGVIPIHAGPAGNLTFLYDLAAQGYDLALIGEAHRQLASPSLIYVGSDDFIPTIINEKYEVVAGIDKSAAGLGGMGGGTSLAPSMLPYLDGTDLRGVGREDVLAAALGDLTVEGIFAGGPNGVRAILNRPHLGPKATVSAGNGYLIPDYDRILHFIPVIGQSLSVGATSASTLVSTTSHYPAHVLMFDGPNADVRMGRATGGDDVEPLDGGALTGFIPLVARAGQGGGSRGETPAEAIGNTLAAISQAIGAGHRMLFAAVGYGGTTYAGLKKGTVAYDDVFLVALARARELAEARGWRLVVPAVYSNHGQSDGNNTSYFDHMIEWQEDIDADVKAVTGQEMDVAFFMSQPSSFQGATTQAAPAMLRAAMESEYHHLTGAEYQFIDQYSDWTHFHGPGYHLIGEVAARAIAKQLWTVEGWDCLHVTDAVLAGSTVTLTYKVPVAPLVFDTTTLIDAAGDPLTERDYLGFVVTDDGEPVTITDATIVDDGTATGEATVVLTLASAPSSTAILNYALTPKPSESVTANDMPRGHVRDSDPTVSTLDGRPLFNWAAHQRIEL